MIESPNTYSMSFQARLVDDLGQFAAHDLDVAFGHAFQHRLGGNVDGPVSVSDEGDDLGVGARILHLPQDVHPLDDLQSRTEKVYGVAAAAEAKLFGSLHHGRVEPKSAQPVGDHQGQQRWRPR